MTSDRRLVTGYYLLLTTYYLLPTTYYLEPTAYGLKPSAYSLFLALDEIKRHPNGAVVAGAFYVGL
jgi:hypothetical protein